MPVNTNLNGPSGRKYPIRSPILVLLVWAILIPICLVTVPMHIVIWLFNGRGFLERTGRSYNYEPPWWAVLFSLAIIAVFFIL